LPKIASRPLKYCFTPKEDYMFKSIKTLVSKVFDKSNDKSQENKSGFFKKLRSKTGSPLIWGSIAVFSPTLVACYGQPYDMSSTEIDYKSAECVDGYVKIYAEITNRRTTNSVEQTTLTGETCTADSSANEMICNVCTSDAARNHFINCDKFCNSTEQTNAVDTPADNEQNNTVDAPADNEQANTVDAPADN